MLVCLHDWKTLVYIIVLNVLGCTDVCPSVGTAKLRMYCEMY